MTSYVITVFRKDRRCKAGEKLQNKNTYANLSKSELFDRVEDWTRSFPEPKFRVEWHPATKIVKSLMTGAEVEIDADTPRCCDPSSELYWTL